MAHYISRQWSWQNPLAAGALLIAALICGIAFVVTDSWTTTPWLVAATFVLLVACGLVPLTIAASARGVHVSLGGVLTRDIAAEEIAEVETRRYRPMREFGGWGWRFGIRDRSARAYTTTGATAVVLTLRDGSEVYLGVADESRCVAALESVRT